MPLDLKYRPKTIEDLVGNEALKISLTQVLSREDRPQVFLFTGPPGTGKTSTARIIASKLNSAYVEELNIANNNGVDFAREFEKKVTYKGFKGDTFYILDECHRLTQDAQKILLTTTEEPPKHVNIALCTSDPSKLDKAFLSRGFHYQLRIPNKQQLLDRLLKICYNEGIETSNEVLEQIYIAKEGIPRDCIKELDKLIGVPVNLQRELITSSIEEQMESIMLAKALLNRANWSKLSSIIDSISNDYEALRRQLIAYVSKVLMSSENIVCYNILTSFKQLPVGPTKNDIVYATFESYLRNKEK